MQSHGKEKFPLSVSMYRNQCPWIKDLMGAGGVLEMQKGGPGMSGLGDSWVQFFALPETVVPPYLIFSPAKRRKFLALEEIAALL